MTLPIEKDLYLDTEYFSLLEQKKLTFINRKIIEKKQKKPFKTCVIAKAKWIIKSKMKPSIG